MPISAADCVGPAFELTKKRLFKPFRFSYWWRIAVLGLLTGEIGGGGGGSNFQLPTRTNSSGGNGLLYTNPDWSQWLPWIIAAGVAIFVVALVFTYIGSVLRFVLFEAVLRDKVRIREGWSRWSSQGFQYFLFKLVTFAIIAVPLAVLVGLPLIGMMKTNGRPDIMSILPELLLGILLLVVLSIVAAVFYVLTKDFVVPQMALEEIGWREGWSRLWPMMKAEKGSFAVYLLLKIALAIAALAVLGFAILILFLVGAIPVGIVALIGVAIAKASAGLGTALAVIGVLLLVFIVIPAGIFCFGFIGAPITVFFPAYSIIYFAGRYKPLFDELYPPPPPQQEQAGKPGFEPAS